MRSPCSSSSRALASDTGLRASLRDSPQLRANAPAENGRGLTPTLYIFGYFFIRFRLLFPDGFFGATSRRGGGAGR